MYASESGEAHGIDAFSISGGAEVGPGWWPSKDCIRWLVGRAGDPSRGSLFKEGRADGSVDLEVETLRRPGPKEGDGLPARIRHLAGEEKWQEDMNGGGEVAWICTRVE